MQDERVVSFCLCRRNRLVYEHQPKKKKKWNLLKLQHFLLTFRLWKVAAALFHAFRSYNSYSYAKLCRIYEFQAHSHNSYFFLTFASSTSLLSCHSYFACILFVLCVWSFIALQAARESRPTTLHAFISSISVRFRFARLCPFRGPQETRPDIKLCLIRMRSARKTSIFVHTHHAYLENELL